jgi:Zn-dependent alcohol dehydrogenase
MAGQITISTLRNDTGVLSVQNGMTGIAKAWVNFLGASGTINGSFNVSSVTRNTTADYTINFTTSMANTNYTVSGATTQDASGWGTVLIAGVNTAPTTMTTSAVRIRTLGYAQYFDPNTVTVVINVT